MRDPSVRRTWWKLMSFSSVARVQLDPDADQPEGDRALPDRPHCLTVLSTRPRTIIIACFGVICRSLAANGAGLGPWNPCSQRRSRPCRAGRAGRYEFKWDGVRALVEVNAGVVRIRSRRGNEVTIAYPELAGLGAGIDDALVDGEIVAFDSGRPSFGLLQTRMHVRVRAQAIRLAATTPVTFIAFDLLRLYGVDLAERPLSERRATLERMVADHPQWTLSPLFDDGPATEAAAREHGLEGVVAKRDASKYRAGARGSDWLKMRFLHRDEFVVVGWEADRDRPDTLSSLLARLLRRCRAGIRRQGRQRPDPRHGQPAAQHAGSCAEQPTRETA